MIDLPVLSFGEGDELTSFQETISAKAGSQCTFLLTDSFGDGLCAPFFECGSYELDVGDALIDSGPEFTDKVEVRFSTSIAQVPSATPPPTSLPMIKSAAPTSLPMIESAVLTEIPVVVTPAPVECSSRRSN